MIGLFNFFCPHLYTNTKNRFPANTPKVCFEHLWEQMHCLQVRGRLCNAD